MALLAGENNSEGLSDKISQARQELLETGTKLEQVATFCSEKFQSQTGLDTTVNYTAQALGSVAYQINLMASSFLDALDQQCTKLTDLESNVNHMDMQMKIYQEKIARQSIAQFAVHKDMNIMKSSRQPPRLPDTDQRYIRQEINYGALDHIGHGIRAQPPQVYGGSMDYASNPGHSSSLASAYSRRSSASGGEYSLGSSITSESQHQMSNSACRNSNVCLRTTQLPQHMTSRMASNTLTRGGRMISTMSRVHPINSQMQNQRQQLHHGISSGGLDAALVGVQPIRYSQTTGRQGNKSQNVPLATVAYTAETLSPQYSRNSASSYHSSNHSESQPVVAGCNMSNERSVKGETLPLPPAIPNDALQSPVSSDQGFLPDPPENLSQPEEEHRNCNISHLKPSDKDVLRQKSTSDPYWAPDYYLLKVITLYSYNKKANDELSFGENELIYVTKKNGDGWWDGVLNGKCGLFPGNFVGAV